MNNNKNQNLDEKTVAVQSSAEKDENIQEKADIDNAAISKEKTENKVKKETVDTKNAAALYTLWFGLDYGSILTAYALYNTVEQMGKKSFLVQKKPELWSEHYADKENIAGKFIYKNCDVLEAYSDDTDKEALDKIDTHVVGSDVVWDREVIGDKSELYFYLSDVQRDTDNRVAYGTSFGTNLNIPIDKRNDCAILLRDFKGVSVKSLDESMAMSNMFYIQPEIVLDPVFLCDKNKYVSCAENSVAHEIEKSSSFIFTYIKNGDERKRNLVLRGNNILLEKYYSPLRNFIDINRYPESKAALGLDPAFHILVEDWLHYIINSDFVITDDYYGMCFAIMYEKNFVVVANRNMKDISRYTTLLEQLDLTERLIYIDDDFKTKDYLFRKPIRYSAVNSKLTKLTANSIEWFKAMLLNDEGNN